MVQSELASTTFGAGGVAKYDLPDGKSVVITAETSRTGEAKTTVEVYEPELDPQGKPIEIPNYFEVSDEGGKDEGAETVWNAKITKK